MRTSKHFVDKSTYEGLNSREKAKKLVKDMESGLVCGTHDIIYNDTDMLHYLPQSIGSEFVKFHMAMKEEGDAYNKERDSYKHPNEICSCYECTGVQFEMDDDSVW